MATTYNVEYRVKGTTPWLTGPTGIAASSGDILSSVSGLTNGTTYQFRFRRVVDGTPSNKVSTVVEATPVQPTTLPASGGSITETGTFSQTVGSGGSSYTATYVRTASKIDISLSSANWTYVAISEVTPAIANPNGGSAFYTTKLSGDQSGVGIRNESVIFKASSRVVTILLDSTYAFTIKVTVQNRDGTVTITPIPV